jgi:hypothetical protein
MVFFVIGVSLLAAVLGLFWLKDQLRSPQLARLANSEPVLRLAVVGAALVVVGLLMMVAALVEP